MPDLLLPSDRESDQAERIRDLENQVQALRTKGDETTHQNELRLEVQRASMRASLREEYRRFEVCRP